MVLAACTSQPSGERPLGTSSPGTSSAGTSSPGTSPPTSTAGTAGPAPATAAPATAGGSPFEPLPPGITVKDAYTSVMVQVTNPPTFPFPGSDGRFHVAYNLVLQNASPVPATIRKLEVVDATSTTKVIASFAGKQLVDPTCGFGELQPPARPSLRAGEGHGDPPAAGAGAVRRLHVRLPSRRRRST